MAVLALACTQSREEVRPRTEVIKPIDHIETCMEHTTLRFGEGFLLITLKDAERIKLIVENYLKTEKPELEPEAYPPGEVFIDCQGVVRMAGWILGSAGARDEALRLTLRTHQSEFFIVQQEIRLRQAEGDWQVDGVGTVIYHRARE